MSNSKNLLIFFSCSIHIHVLFVSETTANNQVPLTPLMSKLSLMQVSEDELNEALLTPASSLRCLNDESSLLKKKKSPRKSLKKSNFRSESRRSITNLHGCDKHLTKAILFVFGYQNISTYLLLSIKCEKDPDFIQCLVCVFFEKILLSFDEFNERLILTKILQSEFLVLRFLKYLPINANLI